MKTVPFCKNVNSLKCFFQASGRHQCNYLVALQKQEFLLQGGDHNWLKGLDHIPQKLRNLYDINKILAHQPWLLTKSHIEVQHFTLFKNFTNQLRHLQTDFEEHLQTLWSLRTVISFWVQVHSFIIERMALFFGSSREKLNLFPSLK